MLQRLPAWRRSSGPQRRCCWLASGAVVLAGLLLAPAWAESALRVRYRCLGRFDAEEVTVLFFNRAPAELVLLEGEQALRLPQQLAASGARYSDGPNTFWIKGDQASWSRGKAPVMACSVLP